MSGDQQQAVWIMTETAAAYAVVVLCVALLVLGAYARWSGRGRK